MGGPGWSGNQIAIDHRFGHGDVGKSPARAGDFRGDGGIAAAVFAFENARGREDLRTMANRCDGLLAIGEMAHDFEHSWIQTNVFGGAAASGRMLSNVALSTKL
jgi:hypothetical protein